MKKIHLLKDIGLNITEKEYRALEVLSYSMMSSMDREGPSSIGKTIDPTEPMIHGTIVDGLIDGSFDVNDYYVSNGADIGGGLKLAIDSYWAYQMFQSDSCSSEIKDYRESLIKHLEGSHVDYYAKKPADWVADKIIKDKAAQDYYRDLSLSVGKTMISPDFLNNATESYNILKSHEFTKHLFEENVEMQDAAYQFKYLLTIRGHKFKAMLDRVIIDHAKKIIYPYDLKTGGKPSLEFENSFFYWRYDLQALIYYVACQRFRDEYFPGYEIDDFKFIYIGRFEHKPLVWTTNLKMLNATIEGFTRNGKFYTGLIQLIKDYDWYVSNSLNVEYPEKVYKDRGILQINTDDIKIKKLEK